jgi:hypothetical protein
MRPAWRSTIFVAIARPMPVPGVLAATVQALKDQEDALDILWLDTDAVVPYPKKPIIPPTFRPNIDEDRFLATELDGVAEQILEELHQLCFTGHGHG